MKKIIAVLLLTLLVNGCTTFTQIRLDAEVDRRCREDGGLKIYETVPTAPEHFDKYGDLKFFKITQHENALGPEYRFIYKRIFYYGGWAAPNQTGGLLSPSMWRTHIQVIRRADNKLLGESIDYSRYGADPGWATTLTPGAPESSYDCPKQGTGESILVKSIFINTAKTGSKP